MANWRHFKVETAELFLSQKGTPKFTAGFSNFHLGLAVTVYEISLYAHICATLVYKMFAL